MPAQPDDIPPDHVAVGRVLGAWGLRGDVKVEPLAPPAALSPGRTVSIAGRPYTIERSRTAGRLAYLKLADIDSREEAISLRGSHITVPEADLEPLEPDQYYRFQLIGLAVRSKEGEYLGRVTDLISTPGSDVLVVTGPRGEVLIPATDDVVQQIDLETGVVTVEIVPGLLP